MPGANYRQVANCADELKEAEFSPVGGEETSGFLQRLIQGIFPTGGRMVSDDASVETEKRSEEPQESAVTNKRKAVVVTKNGDLYELSDRVAFGITGPYLPPTSKRP